VTAHLRAAVARELDEVEPVEQRKGAREIGEEDQARLEQPDEQGLAPFVVAGDLGAELTDARGQLAGREIDLADSRLYEVTRSRRKR
jgi:hypothetical protein